MSKITVFHGSEEKLTLRNIDREYGSGTDDGIGFYVSTNIDRVKPYGKVISQFDFNARKQLSNNSITLPDKVILEIVKESGYYENYGEPYGRITLNDILNEALQDLKYDESDVDIINGIIQAQDDVDSVFNVLDKYDYNHSLGVRHEGDIIVYVLSDLVQVPYKGE